MPDSKPLKLRIPEPGCRPGDQPDFSDFVIPRAGEARRPDVDAPAADVNPPTRDPPTSPGTAKVVFNLTRPTSRPGRRGRGARRTPRRT